MIYDLQRVTITGTDDKTDISQLLELSDEFPFVEWGILVSSKQEGGQRFPSRKWSDKFIHAVTGTGKLRPIAISSHICGRWTREICSDFIAWNELPFIVNFGQRIQINTHAEQLVSNTHLWTNLRNVIHKEIIFQWDGVNDHLAFAAKAIDGLKISVLFDTSGGAGILPGTWPKADRRFNYGYAGGLGPDNIKEQIQLINLAANNYSYWIDMEGRVRTNEILDLDKVRKVLEQSKEFVAQTVRV